MILYTTGKRAARRGPSGRERSERAHHNEPQVCSTLAAITSTEQLVFVPPAIGCHPEFRRPEGLERRRVFCLRPDDQGAARPAPGSPARQTMCSATCIRQHFSPPSGFCGSIYPPPPPPHPPTLDRSRRNAQPCGVWARAAAWRRVCAAAAGGGGRGLRCVRGPARPGPDRPGQLGHRRLCGQGI